MRLYSLFPAETSTIFTASSNIYINIPCEGSEISLINSYLELNFEIIKNTDNYRYTNADDIRLRTFGQISLFSK